MAKEYIEDDQLEEEIENEDDEDRGDSLEDEDLEEDDNEDEDGEEEEDGEDEGEEEETPKKEPRIPKSRLDEVIQQREDAKERNLWLEAQLEKLINNHNKTEDKQIEIEVSTYDYEKAEEDYISLIIEGEIAKASKLRAEINKEQKADMMKLINNIESSASSKAKAESTGAIETERFNTYIESIESKYPFLNSKHKGYNEEAVDTVNTLLAGYVSAGKSKIEGLKLAVSKVAPLYDKTPSDTKQSLGSKRTVEAGKKAAKAASTQPTKFKSSTSTKSVDNSDVNVAKLSEREFAKLTQKELRLLRGD